METVAKLVLAFEQLSTADREDALRLIGESFARGEFAALSNEALARIADETFIELDRGECNSRRFA